MIDLHIVQTHCDLNYSICTLQPFEASTTKNIGSGPIILKIYIPESRYIQGDRILVQVMHWIC